MQGIHSHHNKLGSHAYEIYKINSAWDQLISALANPAPLYPIVLPPNKNTHNILLTTEINNISNEAVNQPQLNDVNNLNETEESPLYTTRQVAKYLNISGRLLYTRFILTGLITPELRDAKPYFSLSQTQAIEHIHQHMSLEQITRLLGCGYSKTAYLINLFDIKPSRILAYSNGTRQYLYRKTEVINLKNVATKRAKKDQQITSSQPAIIGRVYERANKPIFSHKLIQLNTYQPILKTCSKTRKIIAQHKNFYLPTAFLFITEATNNYHNKMSQLLLTASSNRPWK